MVHLRLASVLPTPRALKKSICLAVPALLFFADRADAACYMRPNLSQLPRPHVVVDDATHTVYSTGQKANVLSTGFSFFPTACGLAIGWPVYRAIQITGEWNKVTKTATENVKVKVSTPIFPNSGAATYAGIISQKCKQDPWSVYKASCVSWPAAAWFGLVNNGVSKTQAANGWNTGLIPWTGFDYQGPYPASRPLMGCCWFDPWWGF